MSRSLYASWKRRQMAPVDLVTRREMLRATGAGAAALLLSSCRSLDPPAPPIRRVIVVGAGLAGLAAAHELAAAGYEVMVLEARRRMGGRVLSLADLVAGGVVEGGGELIGGNHPTWIAYAQRFGLELTPVAEPDDADFPVVIGGRRLERAEAEALFEGMDGAFARMTADAAAIDADAPWTGADAPALDRRSTREWLDALGLAPECAVAVATQLANDNGVGLERQSYLGNLAAVKGGGLERYWTESETWRCRGGNNQLVRCLALELGRRRIRPGTVVVRIAWGERGARVQLENGATFAPDDVILTAPPSTWSKIEFDPPLPEALRPQMGIAVKFLAAVKSRFWQASGLAAEAMTDGAVGATWEATRGQPGDAACLTAFSGGPAARACRGWKEEERIEKYLGELESLFPGVRGEFTGSRFMGWPSDPWTLAGYSFPAPGEVTTIGPLLRAGLGSLHFAGEHACPAFVGFMEGALQSGIAAARRLAVRDGVAAAAG